MLLRSWALCALVLWVGCATSADAVDPSVTPRPSKKHAAAAPVADSEDDNEPTPTVAAEAPQHAAPPAAEEPRRPIPAARDDDAGGDAVAPSKDPFGDVGFKEVNQKDWLAGLREKLAKQEKVPPTDLRVSPGLLRAAFVRSPPIVPVKLPVKPGRHAPPRRHEIVVVDNQGRAVATFRAVTAPKSDDPPKDLRFLSEERLVYEVVVPPPEPPKPVAHKPAPRGKPAHEIPHVPTPPALPPRTFVIQPVTPHARPIKCIGVHFTFSHDKARLAFISGPPAAAFVAVDGAQVYPRRGRTIVWSAPAWSKDGHSLAFVEAPAARPARLVLMAELDNPTGDTTWDLPPAAPLDGTNVFWAGTGKLIVGKTQMHPVFSAAFTKEMPGR
jgi:hypothetical protein